MTHIIPYAYITLGTWERTRRVSSNIPTHSVGMLELTPTFGHFARQAHPVAAEWAALAADSGFADQSHLGREVRRITGFSPRRLQQMMAEDESFWFYRLLWQHHRDLG